MDKPIIRVGLPDAETFLYLLAALNSSPDIALEVYTVYQEDIIKQLNIDPSTL